MGFKKKDPFADLNDEFKARVAGAKDEEINGLIRDKALYAERLSELEKEDLDLKSKREIASDAAKVYRDGKKDCKLSVQFCRMVLQGRGRALPGDK